MGDNKCTILLTGTAICKPPPAALYRWGAPESSEAEQIVFVRLRISTLEYKAYLHVPNVSRHFIASRVA